MDSFAAIKREHRDYVIAEKIGCGGFSEVYKAIHMPTGVEIAIKVISKQKLSENILKRELKLLSILDHPFCCAFYESFEDENYWYIAMERVQCGTLLSEINKTRGLKETRARHVFCQLISAIDYLHKELHIAHRDIKAENIMFDRKGNIRLIDFGLGNQYLSDEELLKTACGSPAYAPPEMLTGKPYSNEADIWSSGVVLYAMLTGQLPFNDQNIHKLIKKIIYTEPNYPQSLSDEQRYLLQRLLEKEQGKRITINQIMENPWFLKYNYCGLMDAGFGIEQGWRNGFNTGKYKIDQTVIEQMEKLMIPVDTLIQDINSKNDSTAVISYKILKREKVIDEMIGYTEVPSLEPKVKKTTTVIPKPTMFGRKNLTIFTPIPRPTRLSFSSKRRSISNGEIIINDPGLAMIRAGFIARINSKETQEVPDALPRFVPKRRYSGV